MKNNSIVVLSLGLLLARTPAVLAWGEPHAAITKAAMETLPAWERATLGTEFLALGTLYCVIPDLVYSDRTNAAFAMMDSRPGVLYLLNLHLPAHQPDNLEILGYFMGKAVAALRASNVTHAAKFTGTIAHALEDWSCPAHAMPGDNMFTLMQQFLPPPEDMRHTLLHSPIEAGRLDVSIAGRAPVLLGATVEEAAFHLLQRINEATVFARSQTIPIIQALYVHDSNAVAAAQLKAATMGAKVVADAIHTILTLGTGTTEGGTAGVPPTADLSTFVPLEATNLYFSQATFFSAPYWGHALMGTVLAGGSNAVPLQLRVATNDTMATNTFAAGIGTGTRSSLTYLLPVGVYRRFTALAGLHPELGQGGATEFTVLGDGRKLAAMIRTGADPAHAFDCDIAGVTNLQLLATAAKNGDAERNYAIWAEPRVSK